MAVHHGGRVGGAAHSHAPVFDSVRRNLRLGLANLNCDGVMTGPSATPPFVPDQPYQSVFLHTILFTTPT